MNMQWTRVARADDVPENGTLLVSVGAEPVCLYSINGEIYATHNLCTHGEASLAEGFIFGEEIECPLHQGRFHIPSGRAVGVPCVTDVRTYPVKVEDGSVFLGSPQPVPSD